MNSRSKTDRRIFQDAIERLAAFYPSGRPIDAATVARRWIEQATPFDAEIIEAAVDLAHRERPDYFPTCEQFLGACRRLLGKRLDAERAADRADREWREDDAHARLVNTIPGDKKAQDQWMFSTKDPCEFLRRRWLVESRRNRTKSDATTPTDLGRERFRDLMTAFEAKTNGL